MCVDDVGLVLAGDRCAQSGGVPGADQVEPAAGGADRSLDANPGQGSRFGDHVDGDVDRCEEPGELVHPGRGARDGLAGGSRRAVVAILDQFTLVIRHDCAVDPGAGRNCCGIMVCAR